MEVAEAMGIDHGGLERLFSAVPSGRQRSRP
jgi:hypothetical protein